MTPQEIHTLKERQKKYFNAHKTIPLPLRKQALRRLKKSIQNHEKDIMAALKKDLGKSTKEAYITEVGLVYCEIRTMQKKLDSMAESKWTWTPLHEFPSVSETVRVPYGNVLILSPWNYPFLLTMQPLVDALAAGNTVMLKPSDYSREVSLVMEEIITECFIPDYVCVIQGGREENQSLLDEEFDYIFFTGSKAVGHVVMEKAAAHLTPMTLELGGKSPCIVDETANLALAARRIVFGKFLNAGQTCVAPDYVCVHASIRDDFLRLLKMEIRRQYPSPDDIGKIINEKHFERLKGHEFDKTATGHYADIREIDGRYYLATAPDAVKDQTDFLAQISYEQLSHICFPLGKLSKSQVREIASGINLPNAKRKDSQGICFLGKINYNDFLRRHLGEKRGPVIDIASGRKIGEHKGYWFHTIGQRKGLGLSGGPWYVVRKNVRDEVIYVSNGYDTDKQYGIELPITEMHWITANPFDTEIPLPGQHVTCDKMAITFKNRHSPEFMTATLERIGSDSYLIHSDVRVQGIAPGQFAIIYTPDRQLCLGSGVICSQAKKHKHRNE